MPGFFCPGWDAVKLQYDHVQKTYPEMEHSYTGNDKNELIQKTNLSVVTITAKNIMDAENQSQQIIKNAKEKEI